MLEDKIVYEKFSKNSFEYVQANHDISNIMKEWDDLITNLLD